MVNGLYLTTCDWLMESLFLSTTLSFPGIGRPRRGGRWEWHGGEIRTSHVVRPRMTWALPKSDAIVFFLGGGHSKWFWGDKWWHGQHPKKMDKSIPTNIVRIWTVSFFFWALLPKIETLDSNLKYLSLVLTIKNGPKMSRSTSSRLFWRPMAAMVSEFRLFPGIIPPRHMTCGISSGDGGSQVTCGVPMCAVPWAHVGNGADGTRGSGGWFWDVYL